MDLATVTGLILGFGALIGAFLMEGGTMGALLSVSSLLLVFGGTIGATAVSFGMDQLKKFPVLLRIAFQERNFDSEALIEQIVGLATQARRDSVLSLEENLSSLEDGFLRTGLQMIIDRVDTSVLRDVLENEIYYMEERHRLGVAMFETAGGYAPAMGIIGTVMGLVHVLGNMSSPEALAPAIAVAFIATLYGVSSANLFWLPIGAKLRNKSNLEITYRHLTVEGLLAIQEKENPKFIREKLLAFLNRQATNENWGEK